MSSSDSIAASQEKYRFLKVIDSHTGGEPTRIIVEGGPELGSGSMAERSKIFEAQFDEFRTASINEPRGSDVIVGGILCDPVDPQSTAGVVYFNNASYLGMCGHGTIGLIRTLQYMGRIDVGTHQLETPVGLVQAELDVDGFVSVTNVESYRHRANVCVEVPSIGTVCGDVAWGGNWFFLIKEHSEKIELANVDRLTYFTKQVRLALEAEGISGADGGLIDHIELFTDSDVADSKNFVLCPGGAYDRSPCGTGTSAKMACLAADGKLQPGQTWRQESIVGSIFEGSIEMTDQGVIPTIRGTAHICAESKLVLDSNDPFCMGIS